MARPARPYADFAPESGCHLLFSKKGAQKSRFQKAFLNFASSAKNLGQKSRFSRTQKTDLTKISPRCENPGKDLEKSFSRSTKRGLLKFDSSKGGGIHEGLRG